MWIESGVLAWKYFMPGHWFGHLQFLRLTQLATLCKAWDVLPYLFWLIWHVTQKSDWSCQLRQISCWTHDPYYIKVDFSFFTESNADWKLYNWWNSPNYGKYRWTGDSFKYLQLKKLHPEASSNFNRIHSLKAGASQQFSFEPLCRHCLWILFWPLCVLPGRELWIFWECWVCRTADASALKQQLPPSCQPH